MYYRLWNLQFTIKFGRICYSIITFGPLKGTHNDCAMLVIPEQEYRCNSSPINCKNVIELLTHHLHIHSPNANTYSV